MNIHKKVFISAFTLSVLGFASVALASHAWGNYHWARTSSSFALKLGSNLSSQWTSVLGTVSSDWSLSNVLDTQIVAGQSNVRNCRATLGRVEVCNNRYGNNGWLGIASIWANGDHITQGTVKLNDTYFNTSKYNTIAWRNLVACQEIGHTFGLDHQDEIFDNPNLGTCMDYTNDPSTNQHPNQHDYDELQLIYSHTDTLTTIGQSVSKTGAQNDTGESRSEWGRAIRKDKKGRDNVFEKDLKDGNRVITHVFWAE